MTVADDLERRHLALMELVAYRKWRDKLPELVRLAVDAGIPKTDIAVIIGVNRSTVYEILARQETGVRSGE